MVFLLGVNVVYAGCTNHLNIPVLNVSRTISIGKDVGNDAPFGTVFGRNGVGLISSFGCGNSLASIYIDNIEERYGGSVSYSLPPGQGISSVLPYVFLHAVYNVYTIPNVPEIGYIVHGCTNNIYMGSPINFSSAGYYYVSYGVGWVPVLYRYYGVRDLFSACVKFVKLVDGEFNALPSSFSFDVLSGVHEKYVEYKYNYSDIPFERYEASLTTVFRVTVNLHAVSASCTTPSFPTVQLPVINPGEFTGSNYYTVGETEFKLEFTNCPPYMTDIHFRAEASGGTSPAPSEGLLPLTTGSSASGVVVQVLRGLTGNTPLQLNEWTTLSQYNKSATKSQDFILPFRARYYRFSSNIVPGTVRAAMIVHIKYQ